MSLRDVIREVEGRRKTLTLFNPPDPSIERDLAAYLDDRNVGVRTATTDTGHPEGVAVLYQGQQVLTSTSVGALHDLLDEPRPGEAGLGVDDAAHATLLSHLEETTFASFDVEQLVAASREIEDRAWRVGVGTLRAGFQRATTLDGEADVYRDLTERPLDLHVYAVPDGEPPSLPGVTVHLTEADEIADHWFVVFDGGGDDEQKCALLAEERGDRDFYGFWTYEPDVVDRIADHLATRYGVVSR